MCQILVGLKGLEPSPLAGHDPKSCASASSATGPAVDPFYQFGPRLADAERRVSRFFWLDSFTSS